MENLTIDDRYEELAEEMGGVVHGLTGYSAKGALANIVMAACLDPDNHLAKTILLQVRNHHTCQYDNPHIEDRNEITSCAFV